jgi:putative ABC transport system permease protein
MPADTQVWSQAQLRGYEQYRWVVKTSVGIIFGLGVIVALIVGVGVVYQVLSSDIAWRMAEYATLAAMGYPPRYLARVVVAQATFLAIGGFLPGWLVAWGLFDFTASKARLPMNMTPLLTLIVFVICLVMCLASGLLAVRKLRAVDPAELFT